MISELSTYKAACHVHSLRHGVPRSNFAAEDVVDSQCDCKTSSLGCQYGSVTPLRESRDAEEPHLLQEQQARLVRQRARSGNLPAGAARRAQDLPEDAQPRAGAEAAQHASAAAENGQSASGAAVQVLSPSSQSAIPSGRAEAGREALGASTSKTEEEKPHLAVPRRAATGSAGKMHPNGNGAVDGKKADATGLDSMHRTAMKGLKQANQLRQKHGPAADQAAQAGQAKESLIQAVPEVPDRRASLGWPDAQKGVNIMPPPRQTKGMPHNSKEDLCPHAVESTNNDATETDLEALLGQLVNRAELI